MDQSRRHGNKTALGSMSRPGGELLAKGVGTAEWMPQDGGFPQVKISLPF
jgi:hypothetical protein